MDRIVIKRVQVLSALEQWNSTYSTGQLTVAQVMTAAPSCIGAEVNAFELVRMFHAKHFRHLLVTDSQGCLLGVVSDRDVIRCFAPGESPDKQRLTQITAGELMSTDVVTIEPQATLDKAVALMLQEGISCLPVVAERTLLGILTNTDLHVVLQTLLASPASVVPANAD